MRELRVIKKIPPRIGVLHVAALIPAVASSKRVCLIVLLQPAAEVVGSVRCAVGGVVQVHIVNAAVFRVPSLHNVSAEVPT